MRQPQQATNQRERERMTDEVLMQRHSNVGAYGGPLHQARRENPVVPDGADGYMHSQGGLDQYSAILNGARSADAEEARHWYARGVQEGILDSRLSPAAAAWAVDIAGGISAVNDAPPAVRRELEQLNTLDEVTTGYVDQPRTAR